MLIRCAIWCKLISWCFFCPKPLREMIRIILYDRIRRFQYALSRPIILFKLYYGSIWIIFFEIEDIMYICTSPAVYRLICIADNTKIAISTREYLCQLILRSIRILIFINEYIMESALIFLTDFFIIFQKHYCNHKKVIKIHGIVVLKLFLIQLVNLCRLLLKKSISRIFCKCPGTHKIIFSIWNHIQYSRWLELLLIEIKLFEAFFN